MTTSEQEETAKSPMPSTTSEAEEPLHSTSENIVSVLVGPEAKRYAIDKDLLCSRSGYFKAALTGNFREAEDLVVTLEDEDIETFEKLVEWLNTDVLVGYEGPEIADEEFDGTSLFNVYLFAEKRIILLLQNAAVDAIIPLINDGYIPANEIRHVWTRTTESSPICKLLVNSMLSSYPYREFQKHIDQYEMTFIAAVATCGASFFDEARCFIDSHRGAGMKALVNEAANPWETRCEQYHIHEPSEPRCGGNGWH